MTPITDVLGIKASEAYQIVDPHLGVQKADDDIMTNLRRLVDRYLAKGQKGCKADQTQTASEAVPPAMVSAGVHDELCV